MTSDSWSQEFEKAVREAVPAAFPGFAISVEQAFEGVLVIGTVHCTIKVVMEKKTIATFIKPSQDATPNLPEVQYDISWFREIGDIRPEVERQLRWLAKECRAALEGDFSGWPDQT